MFLAVPEPHLWDFVAFSVQLQKRKSTLWSIVMRYNSGNWGCSISVDCTTVWIVMKFDTDVRVLLRKNLKDVGDYESFHLVTFLGQNSDVSKTYGQFPAKPMTLTSASLRAGLGHKKISHALFGLVPHKQSKLSSKCSEKVYWFNQKR